jgi:hypothetical protein
MTLFHTETLIGTIDSILPMDRAMFFDISDTLYSIDPLGKKSLIDKWITTLENQSIKVLSY